MIFFFHYNKPASKSQKKVVLSLHFQKKCHLVSHVKCNIPLFTKHNKRQPFCVLKGNANKISIENNIAKII